MAACDRDLDLQDAVKEVCARDILFFCNLFCWTYDPRLAEAGKVAELPWITYEFQDRALLDIQAAIGKHDISLEKSRDMGASWMCVLVFLHRWLFDRTACAFLMLSRTEDYVDKPGNPKALFHKVDFLMRYLPDWMIPKSDRSYMHLGNRETGSTIDGESTTKHAARGDRRLAILCDEFAAVENSFHILSATNAATNCRIFNSTPMGSTNAFYVKTHDKTAKIRMHWTSHPVKMKGAWRASGGEELGPYRATAGEILSPWFAEQCEKAGHSKEVSQELNIDYIGSAYQFFQTDVLDRVEREQVRPAYWQGELLFDPETCEFRGLSQSDKGRLKLWIIPDGRDRLPTDRTYTQGNDIANGTGASNSACVLADNKTREKIAEFKDPNIMPHDFANYAMAIAKWAAGPEGAGAFMVWESNGPGRIFGQCVIQAKYRNIYYRRNEESVDSKVTDIPGWYSSVENKIQLLGEYRKALTRGEYVNRSKDAIDEARQYVFTPGGVYHSKSIDTVDTSGARDNHGDVVIADACCYRGMTAMMQIAVKVATVVVAHSVAGRRQAVMRKKRQEQYW